MIRAFFLIFFLLTSVTWADWVPKGFKEWDRLGDPQVHRKRIGGQIANYQKQDKSWAKIENNWVKAGQRYKCENALLKTDASKDGESIVELTYDDNSYTVTQRLVKIGIIDTTTWQWRGIVRMPDWGEPTVTGNVMRWENLTPAIDYEIEKGNGVARHRIVFNTDFLENVRFVYRQSHDSSRFALANQMVFVMNGNIPDTLGLMNERVLADLGDHIFLMPRQTLHFAGQDTLPELRTVVRQRWERSGDTLFCTEYVMASELMRIFDLFPDSGMHHNDETKVIDGTTNVEDTYIRYTTAENNYGGAAHMWVYYRSSALIRVKNVSTELGVGATITGCVDSNYCWVNSTNGEVGAYRVFKPWVEGDEDGVDDDDGDATYSDWASDAYEWTTAGCESADDEGEDNSGDGTGADRKATPEDTQDVTTASTWYGWDISTTLAQGWYDGTINEEGIILVNVEAATGDNYFRSTEHTSTQPFWTFTYTTAGAPEVLHRRRRIILGGQ